MKKIIYAMWFAAGVLLVFLAMLLVKNQARAALSWAEGTAAVSTQKPEDTPAEVQAGQEDEHRVDRAEQGGEKVASAPEHQAAEARRHQAEQVIHQQAQKEELVDIDHGSIICSAPARNLSDMAAAGKV